MRYGAGREYAAESQVYKRANRKSRAGYSRARRFGCAYRTRIGASAEKLGTSDFYRFDSMDEVRAAAVAAAKSVYAEYVARGLAETPAFKGVGTEYIRFAAEKPKLFRLLFMSERDGATDVNTVLGAIDDSAPAILQSVIDGYSLDRDAAERLYLHLWLYAHGIAALIATGVCEFTAGDISDMLTSVFVGMLAREREKNL